MRWLSKTFPGVRALDRVDLDLRTGEVLGLIGENGAGKSTLMRILGGLLAADGGEIRIEGERVRVDSIQKAFDLGISLIHQELNLADNLDIAGNIYLGREPRSKWIGWVDERKLHWDAKEWCREVGLEDPVTTVVATLSPGRQQLVEIAKALSQKARILVMDEPTSSLSLQETERLHSLIRDLKDQGISVIYISHRLSEVLDVTDRILVLRDGVRVGEIETRDADHDSLVRMMVGRSIGEYYVSRHEPDPDPALSVRDLLPPGFLRPVSFEVRRGEILGFAGLVGAGRTEVFRAVFGLDPAGSGEVRIGGDPAAIREPRDAVRAGMGYVPEDRKLQGVILEMALDENITLARLGTGSYLRPLRPAEDRRVARTYTEQLRIRTPSLDQPVMALSGGNQQKVVLAKWLALSPRVLVLDEPTRGIDVRSKSEIYALMDELSRNGVGIVMISSEMEEVVGMSDRVAVMWQRRIMGVLEKGEITEESIMRLATGREKE